MSSSPAPTPTPTPTSSGEQQKQPALSAHDFRVYNSMADRMDLFHNHFRSTWNMLWNACTANKRPGGMSLKTFLGEGIGFAESLTMHHGIEEQYFFPKLAARMPEFNPRTGPLVTQHKEIHEGLDRFEAYLRDCVAGRTEFQMSGLRERMDPWGKVLWAHLDDEVKALGAENMRKYWSKDEIQRMRM